MFEAGGKLNPLEGGLLPPPKILLPSLVVPPPDPKVEEDWLVAVLLPKSPLPPELLVLVLPKSPPPDVAGGLELDPNKPPDGGADVVDVCPKSDVPDVPGAVGCTKEKGGFDWSVMAGVGESGQLTVIYQLHGRL